MVNKPYTTLFMLMSVDGKISSGASDSLDADKDWSQIPGVKEGLHQYYQIERTTDLWSLNTGRVMAKIGVNTHKDIPPKMPCSFVIIDSKPHLTEHGIKYLCDWTKQLILVTSNNQHPAYSAKHDNLHIIYQETINLGLLLEILASDYLVERLTIQSGGTLNGEFLRQKLFDSVDIVVAPLLVGGKATPTLIDGTSIFSPEQLVFLEALKLTSCTVLENSYIRLKYEVL